MLELLVSTNCTTWLLKTGCNGNRVACICRKQMGVNGPQEGRGKKGGAAALVVEQDNVVDETAWDLDDDN